MQGVVYKKRETVNGNIFLWLVVFGSKFFEVMLALCHVTLLLLSGALSLCLFFVLKFVFGANDIVCILSLFDLLSHCVGIYRVIVLNRMSLR